MRSQLPSGGQTEIDPPTTAWISIDTRLSQIIFISLFIVCIHNALPFEEQRFAT